MALYKYCVCTYGLYGYSLTVMAYIVMAFIFMAYVVMAYTVMALYSYGLTPKIPNVVAEPCGNLWSSMTFDLTSGPMAQYPAKIITT